jgi:CHASE3 domain sensor protein
MKQKNNFLEQLRRSREAAKTPPETTGGEKPLEQMSADELTEARKEIEMDLIRAKSAELNELHKARVLGETQEAPGGYPQGKPQGKPQLFPLQKSRRHWR